VTSYIAITCGDCGTTGEAALDQDWWCDGCGETWHVEADPAALVEIGVIERRSRRTLAVSFAGAVALCGLVALVGDAGAALFALPAALALWLLVVVPPVRHRRRAAVERVEAWTVSRAPTRLAS
jgi:hypothetical protein